MEQRHPPAAKSATQQHRQPDDDGHGHRDTRAQETREAGEQAEPIPAIERTVVIREQQLREPEHERADERDLERDQNVLRPGTEEHEHRGRDRREPGPHAGTTHHREHERGGDEMQHHDQGLIRRVAVQAEGGPHEPVDEDRQRRPVLKVRPEQVAGVPGGTRRQEVPVVLGEPALAAPDQQQRKRDQLDCEEAHERGGERVPSTRRRRAGGRVRGQLRVGRCRRLSRQSSPVSSARSGCKAFHTPVDPADAAPACE